MIASHRYAGRSGIANGLSSARVAFATDTFREATFFRGVIGRPVLFREAMAALYQVVVSDFKYRPKDRLEFRAWLEEQDRSFLASLGLRRKEIVARVERLKARRAELDRARLDRLKPFHKARMAYIDYVYTSWFERQYILDPVVTVHPDEVSFEAFSRDESTYARVAAAHETFDRVDEFSCGTTNIDFSIRLHGELERIRSYRQTRLEIGPSGLAVAAEGEDEHVEKKIELLDSWLDGFLQVHSAMSLGLTRVRMAPIDLFNVCRAVSRRRAKHAPRALRIELDPGRPARVVLEPWEQTIELSPASIFEGPKPIVVRTWGRDRLRLLSRLIPACRSVEVYLAGLGLPSIYVLDLGPIRVTLALSGWTDNDWTSGGSKFHLLARRLEVTPDELGRIYEALRSLRLATDVDLAQRAGLGVETTRSALSFLCQVGRAMYDLGGGVYRHRELFLEPFSPADAASLVSKAPAPDEASEEKAGAIVAQGGIRIIPRRPVATGYKISGSASSSPDGGGRVRPLLHVDHEGRIVEGSCTCRAFAKHGMTNGPCEHLLALRLAHMGRLGQEDQPPNVS
ncbi:SWIM zinc finger family protein [Tautonia sociabilis]|uniref:SWIM zinc finger family protein n=1 Tax=Tautonia sociabilis TaxID=2080755 RepID=A0A432MJE7_9BACT|nr:SWIM zinc finger family protein [Tautonia sociabilis]RUL87511.1 SWIM zinc finger family protein [Tautonia sociabilis]